MSKSTMRAKPLIPKLVFFSLFFLVVCASVATAHPAIFGDLDGVPFPVSVEPVNASSTIRPCEVASFAFWVKSAADAEQTIDLGAEPFLEGAYFSENPVAVEPDESKLVNLFVIPPCEQYGTFNIMLLAKARSSSLQAKTMIGSLEVVPDGMIVIAPGAERIRVDYNRSGTTIPLENIGGIDSVYNLSIAGPSWLSITPSLVSIPAGETGSIMAITNPATSVEQGAYRFTIFAKSRETGVEYAKTLQVLLAPYSAQEIQYERLKPLIYTLFSFGILLILLLLLLLLWLLRTRDSRAASRAARLAEKEERRQAKKEAKMAKGQERLERLKEYWALRVKAWFKRGLEREYVLVRKDGSIVRRWPMRLLWTIIALLTIVLIVFVAFWFWALLAPFAMIIAIAVAVIILIGLAWWLIRRYRFRKWKDSFTKKELDDLYDTALEELREEYCLIARESFGVKESLRRVWPIALLVIGMIVGVSTAILAVVFMAVLGALWLPICIAGVVLFLVCLIWLIILCRARKNRFVYGIFPSKEAGEQFLVKTGWKEGITQVSLKLNDDKEDGTIVSVQRHDSLPTFVSPGGVVYKVAEVRASGIEDKDLDSSSVLFKVKRKWLAKNNCQESDVMLLRFDQAKDRWVQDGSVSVIETTPKSVTYSSTVKGLGYLAIVVKSRAKPAQKKGWFSSWFDGDDEGPSLEEEIAARKAAREAALKEQKAAQKAAKKQADLDQEESQDSKKKRAWWFWPLWILVILLLVLLVVFVVWYIDPSLMPPAVASWLGMDTTPKAPSQSNPPIASPPETTPPAQGTPIVTGIPDQVWRANTVHLIDLSRWFEDPDKDPLVFTHTPVSSILIEYNGSIATLTPQTDYAGESQTTFIANDKGGLSARSNSVRLVVQEGPKTFWSEAMKFLREYFPYIIAGLVALAVIVASIVIMRRKDDEE